MPVSHLDKSPRLEISSEFIDLEPLQEFDPASIGPRDPVLARFPDADIIKNGNREVIYLNPGSLNTQFDLVDVSDDLQEDVLSVPDHLAPPVKAAIIQPLQVEKSIS